MTYLFLTNCAEMKRICFKCAALFSHNYRKLSIFAQLIKYLACVKMNAMHVLNRWFSINI